MAETTEPIKGETGVKKILCVFSLFLAVSTADAASLDLAWDLNQEPDLAGYRIYYGTFPGEYINSVDVGFTTAYRLGDLLEDVTFFVAITAYDDAGNESDFSEEVSGFGLIEDDPVDAPDSGIGEEPTGTDRSSDEPKGKKGSHGSEKGRKLGWEK